ncbi:hypothetical protein J7E62_29040 [Variovorax paradoxus]|nr:hypothetical protein [Variovorax paradoxus]
MKAVGRASSCNLLDGHRVVSYFSSRTGRYIPPRYERGDERIEINGHAVIAVNESTAHLTALLTGLGVAQTFAFMAQPHVESGALVELLADWEPPLIARVGGLPVQPAHERQAARLCRLDGGSVRAVRFRS